MAWANQEMAAVEAPAPLGEVALVDGQDTK
jgi:hypothetical protein